MRRSPSIDRISLSKSHYATHHFCLRTQAWVSTQVLASRPRAMSMVILILHMGCHCALVSAVGDIDDLVRLVQHLLIFTAVAVVSAHRITALIAYRTRAHQQAHRHPNSTPAGTEAPAQPTEAQPPKRRGTAPPRSRCQAPPPPLRSPSPSPSRRTSPPWPPPAPGGAAAASGPLSGTTSPPPGRAFRSSVL
eukprot:SAG25_NODE_277_length_10482_cov_6.715919_3_plen_192_part_00